MQALLGVILARPTRRMAEQGHDKQHSEGRGESMGLERQREPALAHEPWGLGLVLMLTGVFVDVLVGLRVCRCRRASLKTTHRGEDIGRHL
jgi:hypothetical protein